MLGLRFRLPRREGAAAGEVQLMLPGRQEWRFSASGGRLSLVNSIYLGDGQARDTKAILVEGHTDAEGAR